MILSDNGVYPICLQSYAADRVRCQNLSFILIFHPSANSFERRNRDLKPQFAVLENKHNECDLRLASIRFAMNAVFHHGIKKIPSF